MKKPSTLVIHPKDPSTTFLEIVYKKLKNATVITGGVTQKELRKIIPEYDRIMIMGHGSPYGLLNVGGFNCKIAHLIDYSFINLLRDKPNNVYIWCNADRFINTFKLKGFYSGMFISEVEEAIVCGLPGTLQEDVDESNMGFVKIVGRNINNKSSVIHKRVKKYYSRIAEKNPVAVYNNNRLYLAE